MKPRVLIAAAAAASFLVAIVIMTVATGGSDGAAAPRSAQFAGLEGLERARAVVAANPGDTEARVALATALLQKVRETGDARLYGQAETQLRRALELDPENANAWLERGSLLLSKHEFSEALAAGRRARALAPEAVTPFGVIVDAYVELGRYNAAARVVQRMVDRRPDLSSYSRVSYLRELHGDVPGAIEAMRRAASAAGDGENAAFTLVTLGHLHFVAGDYEKAVRANRDALQRFPGYEPALSGLADARAALGDMAAARSLWRRALRSRQAPEYAVLLGEAELAAGRRRSAERILARAERMLQGGPRINHERALFAAEHGDPDRGVRLAREVYRAAPSAESASILSWALTQAGDPRAGLRLVPRALRLGTRDPLYLYRAGMTARAAGEPVLARKWLGRALEASPRFSPLYAPRARAALAGL